VNGEIATTATATATAAAAGAFVISTGRASNNGCNPRRKRLIEAIV